MSYQVTSLELQKYDSNITYKKWKIIKRLLLIKEQNYMMNFLSSVTYYYVIVMAILSEQLFDLL